MFPGVVQCYLYDLRSRVDFQGGTFARNLFDENQRIWAPEPPATSPPVFLEPDSSTLAAEGSAVGIHPSTIVVAESETIMLGGIEADGGWGNVSNGSTITATGNVPDSSLWQDHRFQWWVKPLPPGNTWDASQVVLTVNTALNSTNSNSIGDVKICVYSWDTLEPWDTTLIAHRTADLTEGSNSIVLGEDGEFFGIGGSRYRYMIFAWFETYTYGDGSGTTVDIDFDVEAVWELKAAEDDGEIINPRAEFGITE